MYIVLCFYFYALLYHTTFSIHQHIHCLPKTRNLRVTVWSKGLWSTQFVELMYKHKFYKIVQFFLKNYSQLANGLDVASLHLLNAFKNITNVQFSYLLS